MTPRDLLRHLRCRASVQEQEPKALPDGSDPFVKKYPPITTLFVYGTLQRGHTNHRLLRLATFVRKDMLFDHKHISLIAIWPQVGAQVKGEVYQVPDIAMPGIDALEGEGRLYRRVKAHCLLSGEVEVYLPTEETMEWLYGLGGVK